MKHMLATSDRINVRKKMGQRDEQTDRQTDRQITDRWFMLTSTDIDAASVTTCLNCVIN